MTRKDLTYIAAIIDRSGSMENICTDTEGGWRAFVAEQAKQPGECLVSLVDFDTEYRVVYDYTDVHRVPDYSLQPRGGTALHDAIGRTINTLGEKLAALPEEQRPASVIIPILTDGYENSSREFTAAQIKDMIERQQRDYQWAFQFMGANQDAVLTAHGLGIKRSAAITYAGQNVAQTFAATSSNVASYRSSVAAGVPVAAAMDSLSYTDEQRDEAAEDD